MLPVTARMTVFPFNIGWLLLWGGGGGTGMPETEAAGFSISVFARFSYTPSAPVVHCLEMCLYTFRSFGNVRPYQTERSRTGGHLDIGKSGGPLCSSP